MSKELKFDAKGNDYAWLLTVFYIGYIVFEWLALMWKVVPPHIWAAVMVLGFGGIAALQSATKSWSGMMALRFLLGCFEAGFGPGVPYYLSFFYLRKEIGLRIGLFLSAGPLATCFAGALAYGITSGHVSIANWRLLFLIEGLPSVALAAVAFFFVPDSPSKARFLTVEEKEVAEGRAIRQVGGDVSTGSSSRIGSIVWSDIGVALIDPKVILPIASDKMDEMDKMANTDTAQELPYGTDVLLLQCLFLLAASLPSNGHHRNGLHSYRCARPLCSSVLSLLPHRYFQHLHRG